MVLVRGPSGTKPHRLDPRTLRVVGVVRMGNKREYTGGSIGNRPLRS